jgi:hypothetical protein
MRKTEIKNSPYLPLGWRRKRLTAPRKRKEKTYKYTLNNPSKGFTIFFLKIYS